MRKSPLNVVDPSKDLADGDLTQLRDIASRAATGGELDFESLPEPVRLQLIFALNALAHGEAVAAISTTKAMTSSEAARALQMSRTHLTRMCEEGRIEHFTVGTHLRIPGEEVLRILSERAQATIQSRSAATTADQRRRTRAARAAGLV